MKESLDCGCIFVLISQEIADSDVSRAVEELMQKYSDVFPQELPPKLPPMRDLQHY